jgi:hypothetical protein
MSKAMSNSFIGRRSKFQNQEGSRTTLYTERNRKYFGAAAGVWTSSFMIATSLLRYPFLLGGFVETALPPDPEPTPEPATAPPPTAIPVVSTAATPPLPEAPTPVAPAFRDRGTGLVIFGVAQIILGLLAGLMVPLIALSAFMARLAPGGAMPPRQLISGAVTYAFIAAALLALGIGSVRMKRWARALTLVTSWYWLIIGTLGTVSLTAMLPVTMRTALAQAQQNSPGTSAPEITTGVMAVIITVMIVFLAFFLVMVPIAFLIFYSRNDVAETCRRRDPVERWTDRAPLPVLGASVAFFTGSLYSVLVGLTTPMFPFFGHYLTGIPAAGCLVALAALDLYLAIALFRLRLSAWWIAIVAAPVRMLAVALSYSRAGLMQAYSKMGWSDEQLNRLNSNPVLRSRVVLWLGVIFMLAFFGYLLWLKRFFKTSNAPAPPVAAPAQAG